jgi:hypothetical protein
MYYKARTLVGYVGEGKYDWEVELKVYGEDKPFIVLQSENPVRNEGRARLTALKTLLEYMMLDNSKEIKLLYYYDRDEVYDKYISYVIRNGIKWWVDKWVMPDGYQEYKNIDMLQEIVVPLLIPCFERISVVSVNKSNRVF